MKKLSILTALVAMLFLASCQPSGFSESNLVGKWENADKAGDYKVYLQDKVVPYPPDPQNPYNDYKWGKEWNESEGVYEKDLKEHGNGWYMWKMEGNTLTEVSMLDAEKAEVPITLTIKTLTATQFQFERHGRTFLYNKK